MRLHEILTEISKRGSLAGLSAAAITGLGAIGSRFFKNTDNTIANNSNANQAEVRKKEIEIESKIIDKLPNRLEKVLAMTALKQGIYGLELSQLLAQAAHETANFTTLQERGTDNYFLQKYWGKRAAAALGNETVKDAIKYIGRGFIQLTGKDMYEWASAKLKMPQLLVNPDLAAREDVAALIFIAYWKENVERPLRLLKRTWDDTATVSALINRPSVAKKLADPKAAPKIHGIKDRHDKFIYYARILGVYEQIGQKYHDKIDYISSQQNKRNITRGTKPQLSKNVRSGRRM